MNSLQVETLKIEKPKIEFNHKQIEQELEENLKKYEGLVFTEETTTELRAILAELRKGKNAVDGYRKEIKKDLSKPIKEFEDKCKDLNKRFDGVIIPLKKQLDEFEERRKEEKRAEIEKLITNIVSDYELDDKHASKLVVEDDMLAKSRSVKSIEDTLTFKATHLKTEQESSEKDFKLVESNVKALNAEHGTDFNTQAYTSLLEFEDVGSVLEKMRNHILAEVKKREEEERRKQEEAQRQEELKESKQKDFDPLASFIQEDVTFEEPEEIPFSDDLMPDPFADEESTVNYRIIASEEKHNKIKRFLSELGVVVRTDE